MVKGSLTVVGTGIKQLAQMTLESKAHIEQADKVLHVVADPVSEAWIEELNPSAESMQDLYEQGKARFEIYLQMVERILDPVRRGMRVCAVFYGHPGVFVYPSHEAIRRARSEGFSATMLPGVSAEDCLFADLGFDPSKVGCQQFEATHFLVCNRKPDIFSYLILWQVGVVGDLTHNTERKSVHKERSRVLQDALAEYYGSEHRAILYEAAQYPICEPMIVNTTISQLAEQKMTGITTLVLPPKLEVVPDRQVIRRLKVEIGSKQPA